MAYIPIPFESYLDDSPFGWAVHEVLYDAQGVPIDYIFRRVNPAFGELTGLVPQEIEGKRATEVIPHLRDGDFDWVDYYGRLAQEGGSELIEQQAEALGRWYMVHAWSKGDGIFSTLFFDITTMREQSEELAGFFQVNLDLLCIADTDGRFIKVNPQWAGVLGYSEDELESRYFLDFVHPDDLEATLAAIGELSAQHDVLNFVNRYRSKDGVYHWIEWRSHPRGTLIYAAARDITDRILAEESLSRSLSVLDAALDATVDGILIVNLAGHIVRSNQKFAELWGLPDGLVVEQDDDPVLELVANQMADRASFLEKIEWLYAHPEASSLDELLLADGRIFERYSQPQRIGTNIIGRVWSFRDISARKASEDFIESYSRMQELLIRLSTRFINAPHEDEELVINEALAEIGRFAGADRAYIFSYDHGRQLLFNTHEWCAPGIEPVIDSLQGISWKEAPEWVERHFVGQNMVIEDVESLPQDSFTRHILIEQGVKSLIAVPLMDRGTAIGFLGFDSVDGVHIYSERETLILSMFAGMLVSLMKRCALEESLVESKEEADRASRIKAEFLANMSHEIRTPMNAISGFARLLGDSELPADAASLVEKINRSSRLLLGIVNDILDYSKIEAGKLELDPYPFCLTDVLEQVENLFGDNARSKGLEFVIERDPFLSENLLGDALRLTQVLVNLLGNALKFTQKGRVALRISAVPGDGSCRDDVSDSSSLDRQVSGTVCFEVCDSGKGIPPNELSRLFTAFSQGDTSTTRKFGGTGLGLVIASRLVEAMGGSLQVESVWGEGSRFHFCIPLVFLPATQSDACETQDANAFGALDRRGHIAVQSKQRLPSLAGYRILLVEDNELGREVAMRLLSKTGALVDVAVNGQEAVDRADPTRHDLVLMDIQMPVMDGYEAASRILLDYPHLPIVALSAAVTEEDRAQSRALGMVEHLAKPIEEESLARVLSRVLPSGSQPAGVMEGASSSPPVSPGGPSPKVQPYQHGSSRVFPGFAPTLAALLAGSEKDFEYSIRALFRDQLDSSFNELPCILAGNPPVGSEEYQKALLQAHSLKGVAGAVLAERLAGLAAEVEGVLRKKEAVPRDLANEFASAIDEVREGLALILEDWVPAAGDTKKEMTDTWPGQEKRPSILVVDDQAVNAASLIQLLGSDYRVAQADSGRAALSYIDTEGPPDLILLDISMPDMDGYELCQRLKSHAETGDVPIIFITAHSDPADEEKGFEMGAADYIVKPFHATVVRARVNNQLQLRRQNRALRDIALRDGLTGIANRRSWDERYDALWRYTLRSGTPAAIFMVDIDHFKAFNDKYGHAAGDECLRAVAKALSQSLMRPLELVARYGGEEFAAFLPETDTVGAVQVATRMLEAVRALAIPHYFSSAAQIVTVSIGIACHEPDYSSQSGSATLEKPASSSIILKHADAALYRAKSMGRNRLECDNVSL